MTDKQDKTMVEKAFNNFKHNGVHLNFPNGNQISMIWGRGSYTENYGDYTDIATYKDFSTAYSTFMQSNDVEVMVDCSDKLLKQLEKKFDRSNPFGRLNITEWLYIVNAVAKESSNAK